MEEGLCMERDLHKVRSTGVQRAGGDDLRRRILHRVWHRSVTSCTADESWTKLVPFYHPTTSIDKAGILY